MKKTAVAVAIGGNIGPVAENLVKAVRMIHSMGETSVVGVSPLYRTAPVGGPVKADLTPDQPDFINGALLAVTALPPGDFMMKLLEIEAAFGRERAVKDGPRPVDLDVILWDGVTLETEELTLPHPRMQERGFVLAPLADVAPGFVHPVLGRTVAELLRDLGPLKGVEKLAMDFDPLQTGGEP